jgi:hypothetical protein
MKKQIFTFMLSILLSDLAIGQSFQTTIHQVGIDFNHYTIETTASGDYMLSGTMFDALGHTDIHVLKMDATGAVIWEKIINESDDDRALDLVVDPFGDIIVTGYISPKGVSQSELYVVKLDPLGNIIVDQKVTNFDASAGTNIIYSQATGNYLVGGFYANALAVPLTGNEAMVVEFDNGLNYVNHTQFSFGTNEGASINDIVETPSGYFVTGSVSDGAFQLCLAVFLDAALSITSDLSFQSTNSRHIGVSAVYDNALDEICLLSNNSVIHNPQITIISNVSSIPAITTNYYININSSLGASNPAGFQLKLCPWDPTTLIAAGLFATHNNGSGPNIHSNLWAIQLDRLTGAEVDGWYWAAPSPNFKAHGGGVFSTFYGQFPYIFNQEILTDRADGNGFVIIAPVEIGSDFGIDIMTTTNFDHSYCFVQLLFSDGVTMPHTGYTVRPDFTALDFSTPKAIVDPTTTIHSARCEESMSSAMSQFEDKNTASTKKENQVNTINESDFKAPLLMVSTHSSKPSVIAEVSGKELTGEITLLNSLGQTVYTSSSINGNYYREEINLEGLAKGIYVMKYTDINGQILIEKIIYNP